MDHRLRKNSQFAYIYKKGERFHTENFTLFVVKSRFEWYKIGFSISKKLGKANKRNKLKRRMKEIVRNMQIPSFCNYVVLAKENATALEFNELKKEIERLFSKFEKKTCVAGKVSDEHKKKEI